MARSSPRVSRRKSSSGRVRWSRRERHRRGGGAVEDDDVGLGAGGEGADRVGEAEGLGVAAGDPPEGLERVELLAAQGEDLVALVEGAQHRVAGAAADIGGDGAADALLAEADLVVEAAAEEEVGGRAEDGDRAGRGHRGGLAVGEVDRVAEEALRAEQAVALVDVEVVARLGVEREGEVDLVAVLREVGLHVQVGVLGDQRLGHRHLLRGRGDREARRDGVEGAALAVPAGDQPLLSS